MTAMKHCFILSKAPAEEDREQSFLDWCNVSDCNVDERAVSTTAQAALELTKTILSTSSISGAQINNQSHSHSQPMGNLDYSTDACIFSERGRKPEYRPRKQGENTKDDLSWDLNPQLFKYGTDVQTTSEPCYISQSYFIKLCSTPSTPTKKTHRQSWVLRKEQYD